MTFPELMAAFAVVRHPLVAARLLAGLREALGMQMSANDDLLVLLHQRRRDQATAVPTPLKPPVKVNEN